MIYDLELSAVICGGTFFILRRKNLLLPLAKFFIMHYNNKSGKDIF